MNGLLCGRLREFRRLLAQLRGVLMKNVESYSIGVLFAVVTGLGLSTELLLGQSTPASVDAHIAAAKAAAGAEHVGVFNSLCMATEERASSNPAPRASATPAPPPDRAKWHTEPMKVFDNLYYLGQSEYSAWAVNTSAGIIVIDTLFD